MVTGACELVNVDLDQVPHVDGRELLHAGDGCRCVVCVLGYDPAWLACELCGGCGRVCEDDPICGGEGCALCWPSGSHSGVCAPETCPRCGGTGAEVFVIRGDKHDAMGARQPHNARDVQWIET